MTKNLPSIYFYLSQFEWFSQNVLSHLSNANTYLPFLNQQGISDGEYAWIVQTYLNLKAAGFPCEITGTMPQEGIVLVHHNSLSFFLRPGPRLLLIYLKADKPPRPYAQLQVVQNSYEVEKLPNSYYMPHWPIPGLIPRDPARGDLFETIAYFGTGGNLTPELLDPSWEKTLSDMGLRWRFKGRNEWNDFSDVDAILAVRGFNTVPQSWDKEQGAWKPPTKLFNAWLAGVPVLLGNEPAYRDQRQSELSYIEVNSLEETITQIKRLRDDKAFRCAIVENGREQVKQFGVKQTLEAWQMFFTDVAVPAYESWNRRSWLSQKSFILERYLGVKWDGVKRRIGSIKV